MRFLISLVALASVYAQQSFTRIDLIPLSQNFGSGQFNFINKPAPSGARVSFTVSTNIFQNSNLAWILPRFAPPVGGGYLFVDGSNQMSYQTPGGGGGTVNSVGGTLPILSSGGTDPVISCPTCVRTDATSIPTGSVNLGGTGSGNWWNAMYAGTFQVPTLTCPDHVSISATSLFGARIFGKSSSCVVSFDLDQNGVKVSGIGQYWVGANVVIDTGRNATFNNVTVLGTCTGCGGGGGGGGVSSVSALAPISSSGGTTPVITCPTCLRSDLTVAPNFGVNLGTTSNWWNAVYGGSFYVPTGVCVNSSFMGGTSLFGGEIFVKNGSCVVSGKMDANGLWTPGQAAISGERYACIDTSGRIVSRASPCSGT